ncbi:MAG: hypothetical protein ACLRNR_02410 [Anaerostipes hadrus]
MLFLCSFIYFKKKRT